MKWIIVQLITALVVLAVGILLGRIWEARTTARSKKRVRNVADREFQADASSAAINRLATPTITSHQTQF